MIALLKGTLLSRNPDHVVIDVNGVGYRVFVSLNTFYSLPEPGSEVRLDIATIVREDAIHLYGFGDEREKSTFTVLTGVSGVGPKLAMGILGGITPDELWLAVGGRDAARLTKVPGIGKKTAARLVVELEGKLPNLPEAETAAKGPGTRAADDALSALTNLGYPEAKAKPAVDAALKELGASARVEDIIRRALKGVS